MSGNYTHNTFKQEEKNKTAVAPKLELKIINERHYGRMSFQQWEEKPQLTACHLSSKFAYKVPNASLPSFCVPD